MDDVTADSPQAIAELKRQLEQRTVERDEALERQSATAGVLKIISRSAVDLQAVFETLIESAAKLCRADRAAILRLVDGRFQVAATHGFPAEFREFMMARGLDLDRGSASGRAALDGRTVHIPDILEDPDFTVQESQRRVGFRTVLAVPLLREGNPIGALFLTRAVVELFTSQQIDLVTTFADQAVIAIENARLFDELQARTQELSESLQFQTVTSEVLKVISRSPDALQPVLDVIVETSRQLCRSDASTIFLVREGKFHVTAVSGALPKHLEFLRANPAPVDQSGSILSRVAREKRTLHYPNVADDPELSQGITGLGGPRALLTVPLMAGEEVIGAITLRQSHLKPFSARQIEAIETFADQAVIAIGNVRLFEEVQARTRDLTESLQQQTATSDVLKVISRSAFDLQTVLDTLVESAARLCEADMAAITRQQGEKYYRAGSYGFAPEFMAYVKNIPVEPERATITGRTLLEGKVIHVPDVRADPD